MKTRRAAAALGVLCGFACGGDAEDTANSTAEAEAPREAAIDDARLRAAAREPGSWLMHGRTYDEQRFSPLQQITDENAASLQLRWSFPTGTRRGLEATPIVVDGIMYTTGTWSVVFALDAATGELLWQYDPQVPREVGRKACCDVVNRGCRR